MDWDWDAAERELKRALELDPAKGDAHIYYFLILLAMGRRPQALEIALAFALVVGKDALIPNTIDAA